MSSNIVNDVFTLHRPANITSFLSKRNVNACIRNPRQLTYWNNWSLLTVSSRIWRKTKKTSTGLRMSSSSKRSSSSLSFLAAAVRRPSNFGFQWSMVEQGVLERRLRLLLLGSLAWRLAFLCLLSASGLDVDIVLVSGLWMLVWSGAIAEKILKFRCLSTSFNTAVMLGNFSISMHKLMVAVHSSLTREKKTRSVENNLRTTSLIDNSVTGTAFLKRSRYL